jgi:hypothetical protein
LGARLTPLGSPLSYIPTEGDAATGSHLITVIITNSSKFVRFTDNKIIHEQYHVLGYNAV